MNDREQCTDTFLDTVESTDNFAWINPWLVLATFIFALGVVALYELQ
jgi:hypothetical protein